MRNLNIATVDVVVGGVVDVEDVAVIGAFGAIDFFFCCYCC